VTELARRLGLGDGDRAVLLTADDFGLCHAATMGVLEALRAGAVTSAGLLVPAPWARDAAARATDVDVGVHLALTAGLPHYRWGPVTIAPSLLGGDGGFPATVEDLHDHADPEEVHRECVSQLERAALFGIDPTHLSVHDGALFAAPALFDVLVELAEEHRLPLRLPDPRQSRGYGYPLRDLAAARGVIGPDWVCSSTPALFADPAAWVASLDEGVTELVVRPAVDSDELRALAPDAAARVADLDGLLAFGALPAALLAAGVRTLSWSELRDVVRGEPVGAA
jgi:chitin disaccharide deacetylase